MATRLKNLKLVKVDMVDAGANPDADIKFAKRKEDPCDAVAVFDEAVAEAEKGVVKKMISALAKAFGLAGGSEPTDSPDAPVIEPAPLSLPPMPETPDEPDPTQRGGSEPPIKKGATPDMKFDTTKMTTEEKAAYEDLAKRFGSEETPADPAPPVQEPAAPAAGDEDVYKGLHPAVKAEMENLRKFREDTENARLAEVAKKYEILGKKPEELAPVLKSLIAAGGTAYADMISVLDGSVDAINKSGVFDEIGKRGSADSTEGSWAKIEAAATEIQKAKPNLSWADAIDEACIKHPELVSEYEKSRR